MQQGGAGPRLIFYTTLKNCGGSKKPDRWMEHQCDYCTSFCRGAATALEPTYGQKELLAPRDGDGLKWQEDVAQESASARFGVPNKTKTQAAASRVQRGSSPTRTFIVP